MQYFLSGIILRSCQIIVDASIWIALGCFVAAILRNMIGAKKTRQLFGDHSRFGLLIGWAIGMLLPVCSLGVIPVLAELYRIRVKPGTIVAFGLTAPLFNPISVLYGLSLSEPFAILVFAAATVVIVTIMGAIWGRFVTWEDLSGEQPEPDRTPDTGIRRSLSVIYTAGTSFVGWPLLYLVIGVLASAVVASSFASGSLQTATEPDDVWAPAFMAVYVTPVYSTPLLAMSQIGTMFQHGNSVGAAFSLLILGAGVNLGLFVWFAGAFGVRRFLVFAGMLLAVTITLAYCLDKPLYPEGVEAQGHTHAFDIYTHPYAPSSASITSAFSDAREYQLKHGWTGPYVLLILGVLGLVCQFLQAKWNVVEWLNAPVEPTKSTGWDIALPPWVIGMVACVGLIVASVMGTYLYYPPVETALDDLSSFNTECVSAAKSGSYDKVEALVPFCDDLSRRLEVGVYLREGSVDEFRRMKGKIYREKLDILRDNIEAGQLNNIDQEAMDVYRSFLQLSKAFREEAE